jgi:hypothetical protein
MSLDCGTNSFCNNLLWVNFAENFIGRIENNANIIIDDTNYEKIFSELNKYIEIDDLILNTKDYDYLSNLINSAEQNPHKIYQIIFDEMLDLNKEYIRNKFHLIKEDKDFSLDLKKYSDIKSFIHKSFKDFFEESSLKIFNKFKINNIKFIDIFETGIESIKSFKKFNYNENDINEKITDFFERVNTYLSYDINNRADKIDIDKLFTLSFANENCSNSFLFDFDQSNNFNINLDHNECKICPKFSLMRFSHYPETLFPKGCHAAMVFSPEISKKLFLMLLDHTLANQDSVLKVSNVPVCVEKRLEILFEFLLDQNISNENEFKDFIENTEYQKIYSDFDNYFKKYINYDSKKIVYSFYKKHFFNENAKNFHILKNDNFIKNTIKDQKFIKNDVSSNNLQDLKNAINNTKVYINEVSGLADYEIGKTWLRTQDEILKMDKKEIFNINKN